jgi:hypothetical protein
MELGMTVNEYLKHDRCWKRECRIAHAELCYKQAVTPEDKVFWRLVLEANR